MVPHIFSPQIPTEEMSSVGPLGREVLWCLRWRHSRCWDPAPDGDLWRCVWGEEERGC